MAIGKGAYLKAITSSRLGSSRILERTMEGSTPTSVFVGSWNYPKVYAGPLIAPIREECGIMDTPEAWIPAGWSQEEILSCRLDLVRGKRVCDVTRVEDPDACRLQEIALSAGSVESQATFSETPAGTSLSEEHTPFGPSAHLVEFEAESSRFEPHLERCYYDSDLPASDAILALHREGVPFSSIQKALSVGALGTGGKRRMVPTRWSITACDTTLADRFLSRVRQNRLIDTVRVHEFSSLNNHYAVILLPTPWQYEWMEAFLHIRGDEELLFSDHEEFRGKKGYSCVGGCYYSCKMAVLEGLEREGVQAGAIVLREARKGYIPMGVFNVRENVRHAMLQPFREFEDLPSALADVSMRMTFPMERFVTESTVLKSQFRARQTTLDAFFGSKRRGEYRSPGSPALSRQG
ncbi:MAG: hypothetical protein A4E39_00728 [Methanoregulaceae archaeon PtaB.Bin152]|nr:MAG: hypothetical protein A4E39_00728 [Methanoregulaceae archaeon PtaB.Bin152]